MIKKAIALTSIVLPMYCSANPAHFSSEPNPPFIKQAKVLKKDISGKTLITRGIPTAEWRFHKTNDGQHPSGKEQTQLWLLNRARQNPTAEGIWLATTQHAGIANGRSFFNVDTNLLKNEFASYPVKPPAAFDVRLYRAAQQHAQNLINRDSQDHDGQIDLIRAEGFEFNRLRVNVFSYALNAYEAHAAYNIDWGAGPGGMQTGRFHRQAIQSLDGNYSNVGIAAIHETNAATEVGPWITAANFGEALTHNPDHYNRFIVGTVWEDLNDNELYDIGEGVSGVKVLPDHGLFFAITSAGGGYAIPITEAGTYQVNFSGGELNQNINRTAVIIDSSVLLDYEKTQGSQTTDTDELVYIPLSQPCHIVHTGGAGLPFNDNRTEQSFLAWGNATQLNAQRDKNATNDLGVCLPEGNFRPAAMAANITVAAKGSQAKGNVVAYPFGSNAPTASMVNFQANNIANSSIITLNPESNRHFTVKANINSFNSGGSKQANVVIDTLGYFYSRDALAASANPGLSYIPLSQPCRIVNTADINQSFQEPPFDKQGFLAWGTNTALNPQRDVNGSENLGACLPQGGMEPSALMANVTVAAKGSKAIGNVVAFPHASTPPSASLVNFSGNNIANASIITLATHTTPHFDIEARFFNHLPGGSKQANVIIDALGYFYSEDELSRTGESGLSYMPLPQPCRIVDTRGVNRAFNTGNRKTQGFRAWGTVAQLNLQRDQDGSDGLEACQPESNMTPSAIVANVTVAAKFHKSRGNVVAYPPGGAIPKSSLVNFQSNNIANSSIIALNPANTNAQFNIEAQIFNHDPGGSNQAHLIVDVIGYLVPER